MSNQPRRFILQAIDPDLGCPAFEAMFTTDRPDDLRALLGEVAAADSEFEMHYPLEPAEVAAIVDRFDVPFDAGGREVWLCPWKRMRDDVPYLVHTGYELPLLLEGRKQFARMGGEYYPPHRHWNEEFFDRYVAQGLLHKEIELEKFNEPYRARDDHVVEGFRTVYYTRKGEEWRIAAWKLVAKASAKERWNHTFERLEGMLFGYEDWQNDWWIDRLRKQRHQFGTLLIYAAVTPQELATIETAGYRSLPATKRYLKLLTASTENSKDDEQRRSLLTADATHLVRFRVKTLPFVEIVGNEQIAIRELPPDRVPDLNRLILEAIEVV
jgi:hypothetical protein